MKNNRTLINKNWIKPFKPTKGFKSGKEYGRTASREERQAREPKDSKSEKRLSIELGGKIVPN